MFCLPFHKFPLTHSLLDAAYLPFQSHYRGAQVFLGLCQHETCLKTVEVTVVDTMFYRSEIECELFYCSAFQRGGQNMLKVSQDHTQLSDCKMINWIGTLREKHKTALSSLNRLFLSMKCYKHGLFYKLQHSGCIMGGT